MHFLSRVSYGVLFFLVRFEILLGFTGKSLRCRFALWKNYSSARDKMSTKSIFRHNDHRLNRVVQCLIQIRSLANQDKFTTSQPSGPYVFFSQGIETLRILFTFPVPVPVSTSIEEKSDGNS